jgi:hypothetical protein
MVTPKPLSSSSAAKAEPAISSSSTKSTLVHFAKPVFPNIGRFHSAFNASTGS